LAHADGKGGAAGEGVIDMTRDDDQHTTQGVRGGGGSGGGRKLRRANEYPASLRELVSKVFRLCETSKDRRAAEAEMKRIILASEDNGTVMTRNWSQVDPSMIVYALGFGAGDVDIGPSSEPEASRQPTVSPGVPSEAKREEERREEKRSRRAGAAAAVAATAAAVDTERSVAELHVRDARSGEPHHPTTEVQPPLLPTPEGRDAFKVAFAQKVLDVRVPGSPLAGLHLDLMDPRVFERAWVLRTGSEALLTRMDAAIEALTPARNALVDRVRQAAHLMCASYPHAYELVDAVEVHRFGSLVSGLDTPVSDVDLSVSLLLRDGTPLAMGRSQRLMALEHLRVCMDAGAREADGWQTRGTRYHLEVRSAAKVPILTGWVGPDGRRGRGVGQDHGGRVAPEVRFDVSFTDRQTEGVLQQAEKARAAWQRLPALRGVIRVLKLFFERRGLGRVYKGGLSSFCLFCMAHVSVSTFAERHRGMGGDQAHIGLHLLDFCHVYGIAWNKAPISLGVSKRLGGFIDASEPRYSNVEQARRAGFRVPDLAERLVVEDPASAPPEVRDIGYSTYKWSSNVQPELAMFYDVALMDEASLLAHGLERRVLGRTDVSVLERKPGFLDALLFKAQFDGRGSFSFASERGLPSWRLDTPPTPPRGEVLPVAESRRLSLEGDFTSPDEGDQ